VKPCLLFDFDGTIANSIDELYILINDLAPRYGYPQVTPEQFALLRNLPLKQACKIMHLPILRIGHAIHVVLNEYRRIVPYLEPCAGIVSMLTNLKSAGIRMAMISSNHTENVNAFLRNHQLSCFEWVEGTSGIMQKHKHISHQLTKHGLDKDSVFYIGDEARDIKAARKCQIKNISVTWGLHSAENLLSCNPDHLVNNPQEIVEIVSSMDT
jgi:phosphoglycolate phosphatase